MLFLSMGGLLDFAGPTVHSRLAWLPFCLPPTRNEVGILIYGLFAAQSPRPPMPLVYASRNTLRCPLQDSRSGWIRYLLSCGALASPTTYRFIPALSGLPVIRPQSGPSPGAQPVSVYSAVISITQDRLPESAGAIRRLGADPSQSAYEVHGATWYGPRALKSNRPPALAPDIPLCTYSAPEAGVRCSRHLPRDRDHSGCRQTLSSSLVQRV